MTAQRFVADGIEVWCLEDGTAELGAEVFPALDGATRTARLLAAGLDRISTAFNAYLLRHPDGAVDLVDAGYGGRKGPRAGLLLSRMRALGVLPGAIRNLIFTHLHGDHCGGAVRDGQPVFASANVFAHRADLALYDDPQEAGGAMKCAYAGRITALDGTETLPGGLRLWHLPGHSPGHCGLRIGAGFALVGDILHSFALQLPDPALSVVYDRHPDQAARTRRAALTALAQDGAVLSGSHGIGRRFLRVQPQGCGFSAVPA